MRLAIAAVNNQVAQHFGHCEYFLVQNIEKFTVKSEEKIINPPHEKGKLPAFLKEHNIDVLITGNLGSMAVDILDKLGIKSIRGVNGEIHQVAKEFLNGSLVSTDEICEEHQHHNH
ncbi:MAG: NifB/NifX family molybdenum-iron cluster-binding protein [Candidatus Izemoplasmatales bacterium]